MGWPVQAIWSEESDGTDVNACSRTAAGAALCTGDDFGMVRLFRYPCVRGGGRGKGPLPPHKAYKGHMSHVMNTRFLSNDTHMLSVGGNDAAVFQWRHINPDGSTVRTILRTAREDNNQMGYDDSQSEAQLSTSGARVGARGTVHTGHGFY